MNQDIAQMIPIAIGKKGELPAGKEALTDGEKQKMISHVKLLCTQGRVETVYAAMKMAIAIYDYKLFSLWQLEGFETLSDGYESLGFTDRHARRYADFGEALAGFMGYAGKAVTFQMLEAAFPINTLSGKIGVNRLLELAEMHQQALLALEGKKDVTPEQAISGFRELINEASEVKSAKGRSDKQRTQSKRYGEDNPATQEQLTMLVNTSTRELHKVRARWISKLRDASTNYYKPEGLKESPKFRTSFTRFYSEVRDLLDAVYPMLDLVPDESKTIEYILERHRQAGIREDAIEVEAEEISVEEPGRMYTEDELDPVDPGEIPEGLGEVEVDPNLIPDPNLREHVIKEQQKKKNKK